VKSLSTALQAHLDSGATTMAYCWRLIRRDGQVFGFTEHDEDIFCDGTTFEAATGFTASQIEQGLGLSVDNLQATGALSSLSITEADLLAGRYDAATIELLWVNWSDPTQFALVSSGDLGEIKRAGLTFTAELRSLSNRLNQKIGETFGRLCTAVLGDGRCKVDLTLPAYRATATAQSSGALRQLIVTGLSAYASDWFSGGVCSFISGLNAGLAFEIKGHLRTAGVDVLELWMPVPFAIAVGDQATVTAGCRKNLYTCRTKFSNVANHRGYPHIPGSDIVTAYATANAPNQKGGSLLGNG
jgi:uncharacterized phage protein (TIGR02218 family)